jgi:hypothetical protein
MHDKLKAGLAVSMALAIALASTGCVSGGRPGRPPSTPYKGDAIWNISRASAPTDAALVAHDARSARRSPAPTDVR